MIHYKEWMHYIKWRVQKWLKAVDNKKKFM
jgi:hypothetical protein